MQIKFLEIERHFFEKINDSFYRGSQAGAEEMEVLAKQGIKRILNLKTISSEESLKLAKEALERGLEFINIPLSPFNIKNLCRVS